MSASAQRTPAELGNLLGTRLRERRRELGKRLADVAAAAGVSTGYLSTIENGGNVPSLPVLARVARAVDLSLAEVLRTSDSALLAGGRLTSTLGKRRLSAEGSDMLIVRLAGKAGATGRAPVQLGGGDVFVFLLEGALSVDVDGERYELMPGDALHCDRPHSFGWHVRGDERAVSLWATAAAERRLRPA